MVMGGEESDGKKRASLEKWGVVGGGGRGKSEINWEHGDSRRKKCH